MEIDIKNLSSSIRLIQVSGEMDMYNYQELKKNFLSLSDEGIRGFIIDCENLTYIDSSGVSTLIYMYTTAKKQSNKMWIVNVNGPVLKVLELTKLTEFLPLAGSLDSLLGQFRGKKGSVNRTSR